MGGISVVSAIWRRPVHLAHARAGEGVENLPHRGWSIAARSQLPARLDPARRGWARRRLRSARSSSARRSIARAVPEAGEHLAVRRTPAVDLNRACGDADGSDLGPEPRAQDRLSPLLGESCDFGARIWASRAVQTWLPALVGAPLGRRLRRHCRLCCNLGACPHRLEQESGKRRWCRDRVFRLRPVAASADGAERIGRTRRSAA